MNSIRIPAGYRPTLDAYDTQRAIAYIKQTTVRYAPRSIPS